MLAAKLDDIFAEVGFNGGDAGIFEGTIQVDLFGNHRLALGHDLRIQSAAQANDDCLRFLGGRSPMDLAALLRHLSLIGFQIEVEMSERVVLDVARLIAEPVELRQPILGFLALFHKPRLGKAQRALQRRIA